jgi:signal transduction histidine kinase
LSSSLPGIQAKDRSVLGQLIHALNQPLTGLQCSMEVALAVPRTTDQYMRGLSDGLVLTERMRMLVEALREVVDIQEEDVASSAENVDLFGVLRESVEELMQDAESKGVRMVMDFSPGLSGASTLAVRFPSAALTGGIFPLLNAAIACADQGTKVTVAAGIDGRGWFRVGWMTMVAEEVKSQLSRAELGLLVAQVRLEHGGAGWKRERVQGGERVMVRLPG